MLLLVFGKVPQVSQQECLHHGQYTNVFFFQAEDGIRDVERSRGLGDVYKRQVLNF